MKCVLKYLSFVRLLVQFFYLTIRTYLGLITEVLKENGIKLPIQTQRKNIRF